LLSVIIPVFNEERTLDHLLHRVVEGPYPYPEKEVIVIDDGSTDQTPEILRGWQNRPGICALHHPVNRGKGAAVRTGVLRAQGEVLIIQDADLEYDPAEYPCLVEVIRRGEAQVVYGSRYLRPDRPLAWTRFRMAVLLLNWWVRLLYGQRLTDEATCYKAMRTAFARSLDLRAERFELCAELTAKICRRGVPILEVPISYHPRGCADGKKIGWWDAWEMAWTLTKWRVLPFPATDGGPARGPLEGPVEGTNGRGTGAGRMAVPVPVPLSAGPGPQRSTDGAFP
jgi:glycosyltransferase involved in cell wall biosynthesis